MKITYGVLASKHARAMRAYARNQKRLSDDVQRLDDEIARIKAKRAAAKYPHFIDRCIEPIAKMTAPLLGNYSWEVFGPFGLLSRTSIHFYRKGVPQERRFSGRNCLSLTFVPEPTGSGIKILDETTGGPLAHLDPHGARYERVAIPADADGKWFVRWINRKHRIARLQDAKQRTKE